MPKKDEENTREKEEHLNKVGFELCNTLFVNQECTHISQKSLYNLPNKSKSIYNMESCEIQQECGYLEYHFFFFLWNLEYHIRG